MKVVKILATFAVVAASAASAFAQTDKDYIRTFGQLMYERNGLTDLKLTPDEFNVFVEGMKAALEGKSLPENMQQERCRKSAG